jgi:hypothetical protein
MCGRQPHATHKPLAGTTLTHYVSQLAGMFNYASKQRLVSRTWRPPNRNMDLPGPARPGPTPIRTNDFSSHDVDRLVKVAGLLDMRWRQMPARIRVAYCTGLRAGNMRELR